MNVDEGLMRTFEIVPCERLIFLKDVKNTLFKNVAFRNISDKIMSLAYGYDIIPAIESFDSYGALCILRDGQYINDTNDIWNIAARYGCFDVIEWLHENHIDGCISNTMDIAASNGHIEIVKYLDRHRKGCTTDAIDLAAKGGHFDIVRYLAENRTEGCTKNAVFSTVWGHPDSPIAKYIIERNLIVS